MFAQSCIGVHVNQFRLDEFVARGAMGMVFKAHDTVLGRTVAIKLISSTDEGDVVDDGFGNREEARRRLLQEAKAAGRLCHPNIVTVHSYGETPEFLYICMEFVRGRTLASLLHERKRLSGREAICVFEQILLALEAAAAEGIVHRDLKPSNIMITAEGKVKVMDFGVARLPLSSMTTTGTILGTPYYMSPEQIAGERVDVRSDIFSLGVLLYEVLTGAKPFAGDTTAAVIYKILHAEPIPPTSVSREVPSPLSDVVLKALAKKKEDRYATPTDMLAALRLSPATPLNDRPEEDSDTLVAGISQLREQSRLEPTVASTTEAAAYNKKAPSPAQEPPQDNAPLLSPPDRSNPELSGNLLGQPCAAERTDEQPSEPENMEDQPAVEMVVEGAKESQPRPVTRTFPWRAVVSVCLLLGALGIGLASLRKHNPAPPITPIREDSTRDVKPSKPLKSATGSEVEAPSKPIERQGTTTPDRLSGVEPQDSRTPPSAKSESELRKGSMTASLVQPNGQESAEGVSGRGNEPSQTEQPSIRGTPQPDDATAHVSPPVREDPLQQRLQALLIKAQAAKSEARITSPKGDSVLAYSSEIFSLDPKNTPTLRMALNAAAERVGLARNESASRNVGKAKEHLSEATELLRAIPNQLANDHKTEISALQEDIKALLGRIEKTPASSVPSRAQKSQKAPQPSNLNLGILDEPWPTTGPNSADTPKRQPGSSKSELKILKEELR